MIASFHHPIKVWVYIYIIGYNSIYIYIHIIIRVCTNMHNCIWLIKMTDWLMWAHPVRNDTRLSISMTRPCRMPHAACCCMLPLRSGESYRELLVWCGGLRSGAASGDLETAHFGQRLDFVGGPARHRLFRWFYYDLLYSLPFSLNICRSRGRTNTNMILRFYQPIYIYIRVYIYILYIYYSIIIICIIC